MDESGDGHYIWTHKKFDIGFNGGYIVDVNLTSETKVKLKPGVKIPFSYEVNYGFLSLLKYMSIRLVTGKINYTPI